MAAVQQHTPTSSETRRSKAFMESMEEEMRRCSEHLQRRQSKRSFDRTLNGFTRAGRSDEMNGGEEAGARRKRVSTLPRSFTMPSEPESRDLPYIRQRSSRLSSRNTRPLSGSMKTPIGANMHDPSSSDYHNDEDNHERTPVNEYRGSSAPPESAYGYYTGSSGSEREYSSRESSTTPIQSPVGHGSSRSRLRSGSGSPRSSMSPPPVAPKPSGRSRERAWSQKRKGTGRQQQYSGSAGAMEKECKPRVIKALPEDSSSVKTIPVSNEPIQVPLSPLEFPSAEVDMSAFGEFGGVHPQTPTIEPRPTVAEPTTVEHTTTPLESSPPKADCLPESEASCDEPTTIEHTTHTESGPSIADYPPESEASNDDIIPDNSTTSTEDVEVFPNTPIEPVVSDSTATDKTKESDPSEEPVSLPENNVEQVEEPSSPVQQADLLESEGVDECPEKELDEPTLASTNRPNEEVAKENEVEKPMDNSVTEVIKDPVFETTEPLVSELSAPEIKSIPKKVKHRSSSTPREVPPNEVVVKKQNDISQGKPKRTHHRTLSESKIHITVSSSVNMADIIQSTQGTTLDREVGVNASKDQMDEKTFLIIKDLQIKLREKEEDLARAARQRDREIREKDDQIKKLTKDSKKIEREKWELLKRARDAAERALHLRTQLDMKEGTLRSAQSELDRTRDELFSVKSANTSLRALLSELRAPRSGVDVGVQVELGGTLKRNRSMELAFSEGGLSQEHQENGNERTSDFRVSTTSLQWPERSNSERWDREISVDSSSLCEEGVVLSAGASTSQPIVPWDIKKTKKKRTSLLSGKLRRSTGSKRGSVTSVDGLDMSNSSILQGAGHRGTTPIPFPYHTVPPDMKEHWRLLDEARSIPFDKWMQPTILAWIEAGLGMSQYTAAVREKAPSGQAMLSLSETDMEKKLGIVNPLHRRKLRLAIDEQKDPANCRYPHAGKIQHSWVAFEWAHDCGLAHLTEVLVSNLVDGRLLNTMSKEDIRKYLKINKKTDQLSFLSAVELLRMHEFNREAIQEHRRMASNPLYWTNRDVCDWLKEIQLDEYASNVIGGGVHGALLFLERGRFSSEHLASIIQIPSSKGQLKRHLTGKMARLFTEDVSQSVESIPSHLMLSNSPVGLSPHGSQSPERRHLSHSPHHTGTGSPPPLADCPHPSRKNSLSQHSQPHPQKIERLLQPSPPRPRQFTRTGSGPSPRQQRRSQVAAAERVRLSLRESAMRSVTSIHEENTPSTMATPAVRNSTPTMRSFTPTILSSTGTTV